MRAALALGLGLVALLPGCARLIWQRQTLDEPIAEQRTDALTAGRDTLGTCLDALGAPTRVWETAAGQIALAYGWRYDIGWSFNISYSFYRFASASLSVSEDDLKLTGVVLLFDDDLRLAAVRRGFLAQIAPDARRRPAAALDEGS